MRQLSLPRWAEKGIASYPGLHGRPKPANLQTRSPRATLAAALRSPQTMFTFFGQFLVFLTPNLMLASLLAAAANQVRSLSSSISVQLIHDSPVEAATSCQGRSHAQSAVLGTWPLHIPCVHAYAPFPGRLTVRTCTPLHSSGPSSMASSRRVGVMGAGMGADWESWSAG